MNTDTLLPVGEVLAAVERLLDRVDPARAGTDPGVRLEWVRAARRIHDRTGALATTLVGEAEQVKAAERAAGTPLSSWLSGHETLSRKEAGGVIAQARSLASHPDVGQAASEGRLGISQTRAITKVLDGLGPQLDDTQQVAAEQVMIDLAKTLDAEQLARSAKKVLAEVAPTDADELLETKLQRDVEAAHRARSLRFWFEGASVRFDGCLPRLEAEAWLAQLDAHGELLRRTAVEARDPLLEFTTSEQRRADSLIALIHASAHSEPAPGVGAARVLVKLSYNELLADAAGAGLIGEGQHLSAGELRRVCCDAELIPVVLGGASEVLNVGRGSRLVTPPIRTALTARDEGCAFPGCRMRPNRCEAHHIQPWWAGGETALSNLVLLCHHHHGLVEPTKHGLRDQWQVEIAGDGLPQFIPPARLDPTRAPRRRKPTDNRAADSVRGGPVRGRPAQGRPVQAEPARSGPVRGGPVRGGPVQAEPARSGSVRDGPASEWTSDSWLDEAGGEREEHTHSGLSKTHAVARNESTTRVRH
ncbi:MAG TPA: DUF222 domain-containing protein [Propionicimonas sp.]|nr:DUF222 domain-containing protein [Propionicimonas sp.]